MTFGCHLSFSGFFTGLLCVVVRGQSIEKLRPCFSGCAASSVALLSFTVSKKRSARAMEQIEFASFLDPV